MAITKTTPDGKTTTVTYVGRVLDVGTTVARAMSDVYCDATTATVLTDSGEVRTITVKYHFELDRNEVHVEVDATDAVHNYLAAKEELASAKDRLSRIYREIADAGRIKPEPDPRVGDRVEVTRTTKSSKKGAVGKVFWAGECRFSGKPRYGVKTDEGETMWVNRPSVRNLGYDLEEAKSEASRRYEDALSRLGDDVAVAERDVKAAEEMVSEALAEALEAKAA